jgi:hypothetical protein
MHPQASDKRDGPSPFQGKTARLILCSLQRVLRGLASLPRQFLVILDGRMQPAQERAEPVLTPRGLPRTARRGLYPDFIAASPQGGIK